MSIIQNTKNLFKGIKKTILNVKNLIIYNIRTIELKLINLRDTNYQLGLKHLNNGNLNDALLRFRIMRNFWPDDKEALYQLSYCYILKEKDEVAEAILDEILLIDENFEKANALLKIIENNEQNKIREEYFSKIKETKKTKEETEEKTKKTEVKKEETEVKEDSKSDNKKTKKETINKPNKTKK